MKNEKSPLLKEENPGKNNEIHGISENSKKIKKEKKKKKSGRSASKSKSKNINLINPNLENKKVSALEEGEDEDANIDGNLL